MWACGGLGLGGFVDPGFRFLEEKVGAQNQLGFDRFLLMIILTSRQLFDDFDESLALLNGDKFGLGYFNDDFLTFMYKAIYKIFKGA